MLDKRQAVIQKMFADIAPRYDLANRLLSFRFDVQWRKKVARLLLPAPGRVLDLAAGTGDLTVALSRWGEHEVVSADFTYEMLHFGRAKVAGGAGRASQVAADALTLPFAGGSFDAVTVAFGIRNFAEPRGGLAEIRRVLRPGGVAGILEFSKPRQPLSAFYSIYSRHILPRMGALITGRRDPYDYLPASVESFPEGDRFLQLMAESGFSQLEQTRMTGGIVTFYKGFK